MAYYRPLCLFSCSVAIVAFSGCATVDVGVGDFFGHLEEQPAVTAQPAVPPDMPAFTVEVRQTNETPMLQSVALDRVVYIQDALEKTGVLKRFRRMDVELYRPLPKDGRYHRFEVRYDRHAGRIDSAFDYALQPADRLVIIEDNSTVLDDMLGAISDRFGLTGP